MKLWISGRIDHDIDNYFFGDVFHSIENMVNPVIEKKNYGGLIDSFDVITVIYRNCDKSSESFKYNARNKSTDIEVCIDYDEFKKKDLRIGRLLFVDALLYAVENLKKNKKLTGFDFESLTADLNLIRTEIERQ